MTKKYFGLVLAVLLLTAVAFAADTSALHPPAGSKVAIVVFEDLQCPSCSSLEPTLVQAAKNYHVQLVRHDFPIPSHNWSPEAHIMARYFDTVSPQLGEEFRHWVFMNQPSIYKTNLRQMADRFAKQHGTALPAFLDPTGALKAKVNADFELGKRVGVVHTPTVYVVSTSRSNPVVEVKDNSQLFQIVDQVLKQGRQEPAPASATKKHHR